MKTKSDNITSRAYLVPFVLVTCLFFLWGFARSILDVLNKHFQQTLSIGITRSAWIQVVTYLGYFLMAIPAGMFITRFGYRKGVVFGLSLFAVGAFMFIPCSHVGTLNAFLICLFVIACGLAFLETSANPYAAQLGPAETATSRLNLSQSFNGMGSFLAPLLVGTFLFDPAREGQHINVSLPYLVMGCIVVVIAIIFSVVKLPEIKAAEDEEVDESQPTSMQSLKALFHKPIFLLGLFALLCYEVGEISINSYFVNFTTDMGWLRSSTASYILSLALVVFMLGRFLGAAIMMLLRAEKMLLLCAAGSVICMLIVLIFGHFSHTTGIKWIGSISMAFLIGNYLFESIMFPTIFSLTLRNLGAHTKTGSSLLMMTPVGGCGFLLVAFLADKSTPVLPFVIPLCMFLVILVYAWRSLQSNRK